MRAILVTGASGFVGSYFARKYSEIYEINRFSFRNNDITNLNLNGIDTILHLSALVHQMGGASAKEYERVNVTQTLELAKQAKERGVRQFVYMSSVKVYGEETDTSYNENTPCHPEDEYGRSKLKAEQELEKLEDKNFKVSIIRTPVVYGYGVKANIKFLVSLINKVPILPLKEIDNRRSIAYIGNLCALTDSVITQKKSGIFIASDDRVLSTPELCKLIAQSLDKKVYLIKIPFFESFLKLLKPSLYKRLYGSLEVDNTTTKQRLNFKNPYTTEEGIRYMVYGESF